MSDQRKTHPGDTIKETLKLVFATDPQSVCSCSRFKNGAGDELCSPLHAWRCNRGKGRARSVGNGRWDGQILHLVPLALCAVLKLGKAKEHLLQ